jgi:hypothetical protein
MQSDVMDLQGQQEGEQYRLILTLDTPESFVFIYTIEERERLFMLLGKMVADPECSLTQSHANLLLEKFQQLLQGVMDEKSYFAKIIGWEAAAYRLRMPMIRHSQ